MAPKPSAAPQPSSESSATPSTALQVVLVERSGRADAVAVWFDLWLDGERTERDVVSTRPERSNHRDSSGWVSFVVASLVPLCCVDDRVKASFEWFVRPYIRCTMFWCRALPFFPGTKALSCCRAHQVEMHRSSLSYALLTTRVSRTVPILMLDAGRWHLFFVRDRRERRRRNGLGSGRRARQAPLHVALR